MLIRHELTIPTNAANVHISGTIDNNAAVYINGTLVDDVQSGSCEADAIDADIPAADLGATNLLAIRATDLGSADFVDVQVTYDAPTPTGYVALGDSFSSGEGNPPYDAGTNVPTDKCHRSPKAYPHVLNHRQTNEWNLDPNGFVACSGSVIQNVVYGQTSKTHREGSQLSKLSDTTAKVTISVGGNNADFPSVIQDCVYGVNFPGVNGSRDCANKVFTGDNSTQGMTLQNYEQALISQLGDDLPCTSNKGDFPPQCSGLVPSLAHLYELIQSDAPNATIYVLLYPHLFNDNPGPARCDLYGAGSSHIYISQANIEFINGGADKVDAEIISQVKEAQQAGTDVEYIDPRPIFDDTANKQGHGVCSKHPWINGIHLTHNGINGAKVAPESFHPNSSGQAAFADAIQEQG